MVHKEPKERKGQWGLQDLQLQQQVVSPTQGGGTPTVHLEPPYPMLGKLQCHILVIVHGGAANYMCMPNNPDYSLSYRSGSQGYSIMYVTQYQGAVVSRSSSRSAVCAVCYVSTKNTVLMIPAKTSCPSGWTREYYGYLMSEHTSHYHTMFECVDMSMVSLYSSYSSYLYHVEAYCGVLSCPPYDNYRELNCVVCTK